MIPIRFEIVLARLARGDSCASTSPFSLTAGKGEARSEIAGQTILVEARSKPDEDRGDGGAFDPHEMGGKLHGKMRKTYAGQSAGVSEPLVIFFASKRLIQDTETEAAITRILYDPKSKTLSGMQLQRNLPRQPHVVLAESACPASTNANCRRRPAVALRTEVTSRNRSRLI